MTALTEIENRIRILASRIQAPERALPTFGYSEDGRPHVEIDSRGFHYVVVERGQEQSRSTTSEQDELLWLVFESITFSLACSFELRNRIPGRDARRIMFSKQVELLSQLSPEWAAREIDNHLDILRNHPFDDLASERATLSLTLRQGGRISADEAWRQACEKYPQPRPTENSQPDD